MKYLSEVKGKGGIVARVVAKSCSANNHESVVCTFELEYHRWIHGELMTHRLFSRNAMSSRAVPVSKMIEQVRNNPATPIHWGAKQSGMRADNECESSVLLNLDDVDSMKLCREEGWEIIASKLCEWAESYDKAGYHKQIVNRLLEPFQMMKTVLTATEFDNFFWLRIDPDAQPEIRELARCMYKAYNKATTESLKYGEWHTPYVEHFLASDGDALVEYIVDGLGVSKDEAIAISSSCCAQVSYRNIDNSCEKALSVYERLGVGGNKIHASPFEHVCTPMLYDNEDLEAPYPNLTDDWPEGVTHMYRNGDLWSGNLKGWIQHRQLLPNHTCWEYEEQQ